ncbi:MAG: tetratricopeptide repeat protein [Proteobacteria bacterium]|jgi:tetratricopeptide (TPR) repeat protein|uniref:Tetratricopeptide repeat protein n=1 Tax=Candidatus Fonsibacter lacus TaxID=2576439 RepID=A0A845S5U7_9PROT|nr:tetratricopeptide repeat protein [Candidatus Fonsibacter lacus]NBP60296.1 tetratricopeptide repeat protein [Pseudomonadota bacterium]NBO62955.1 tetratricopeptide repeat protein [Candidatus Fonsibacter lacus]NBP31411.1 tetratricopeptide repeat protein [Candidatus Fonsibacter lacus]NBQ00104.1 tetratricopeptide repeat protein [Pseudomonadota bacterium]
MIKTIFLSFLLIFSFNTLNVSAADSGPPPQVIQKTNPSYAEAKTLVKSKKFDQAVVMLEELLKDSKNSNNPDILNDYAYSLRNLKQYDKAEKFYLAALKINPKHIGANEYLGELYLQTKRPDEAKKRLEVLKACNCEEYKELKEKIEKYK